MRETGPDSGRRAHRSRGSALLNRIGGFLSRYNTTGKLGVAVSGGSDSMALLHLLAERAFGPFNVLHFNHGLRGQESDGDEAFVRDTAQGLGLDFVCERAAEAPKSNLEAWARQARRDFFARQRGRLELDWIGTGHTRDDQAETVLMRILRGAGGAGLAGILPVTQEGLMRPLLGCTRAELREYLIGRNLSWREDRTNLEPAFADRNRVRLALLPHLRDEWNPQLNRALAQLAEVSQAEEIYWAAQVDRLLPPDLIFEVRAIKTLPLALQRRLMRRAIERAKGDLRQMEFLHVEKALALLDRHRGDGRVELPGRVIVERSFGQLRVALEAAAEPVAVTWRRVGTISTGMGAYNKESSYLDAGKVTLPLVLRSWNSGDVFRPAGTIGPKSMKDLFQRAKVPCWERAGWPMLVSKGSIVWTRGFGAAAGFEAGPGTASVIEIEDFGKPERKLESNHRLQASIQVG